MIVALDPGKNIGLAFVSEEGRLLEARIVSLNELGHIDLPADATFLVGDGTGSAQVQAALRQRSLDFEIIDETGTTLEARAFYFRDHPPKGLFRFLPRGLWSPPEPIDDYAAYAIARRYLKTLFPKL